MNPQLITLSYWYEIDHTSQTTETERIIFDTSYKTFKEKMAMFRNQLDMTKITHLQLFSHEMEEYERRVAALAQSIENAYLHELRDLTDITGKTRLIKQKLKLSVVASDTNKAAEHRVRISITTPPYLLVLDTNSRLVLVNREDVPKFGNAEPVDCFCLALEGSTAIASVQLLKPMP